MTSLREKILPLLHPRVRACAIERARHIGFIAVRSAVSLAVLSTLPPYLICYGFPTGWGLTALLCSMVAPIAVVLVVRTGRVAVAQALCIVGIAGLVISLNEAGAAGGAVLAWLLVLPLEALLLERVAFVVAGLSCALLTAIFLLLVPRLGSAAVPVLAGPLSLAPPLLYATGLVLALLYSGQARRSVHAALIGELDTLRKVAGNLVLRLDRKGVVIAVDDGADTLTAETSKALRGRGLFERINVADRPAYLKTVADAAASDQPPAVILRLRKASTDSICSDRAFDTVEMHCVRNARMPVSEACVLAVVRCIDEERRHVVSTPPLGPAEGRDDLWKDRFLAIVSHELRTPLNAIIGFSEMLGSPELAPRDTAKQREYAGIINTSGQHLLAVVNSILDVSKIEAGSFDIVPDPFEVRSLIDTSCDMVRLRIIRGDLELVRACEPGLPELVADKRACKQILINLLSNAIKFTPAHGRVTVGARREGSDCVLFVSDTGIGIKARDLPHLGAPFFQAQGDYDRRYEGTGLGLSVVRGLVGLHGGAIAVTSAPGSGTCVEVRLPIDGPRGRSSLAGIARIDIAPHPSTIHTAQNEPMKVKQIA